MKPRKFSVLIADDDLDDHEFIRTALKQVCSSVEISAVYNGAQLIDYLYQRDAYRNIQDQADLVILDLNMPKMDGFTVLANVKADENLNRIPMILFSTSTYDWEISKAMRLGAQHFYSKPSDPAEYIRIMKEICEKYVTGAGFRP